MVYGFSRRGTNLYRRTDNLFIARNNDESGGELKFRIILGENKESSIQPDSCQPPISQL